MRRSFVVLCRPDEGISQCGCMAEFDRPSPAQRGSSIGLTASISRRDFLNGVLLTGAGLLLHNKAPTISPDDAFNGYGGIGDYAHSNGNTWEVLSAGHAMRDGAFEKRIANATDTGEIYDLVAVGGG